MAVIFLDRVRDEVGLELEIVSRETEARLAVMGCASLVDRDGDGAILFDIGGGSSELVWLDTRSRSGSGLSAIGRSIRAWTSLPVGVVTLADRHGGLDVDDEKFERMTAEVSEMLERFDRATPSTAPRARGGCIFSAPRAR